MPDGDDTKAAEPDVVCSAIADKDTNIPAGGFLVVTNRQPADSILAGGVDLHDSNKFPAGASQLYVVTDVNMPASKGSCWFSETATIRTITRRS